MEKNEINIDDFLKDISIPRTKDELDSYYKLIMEKIDSDRSLLKLARLRVGLFKEFFEELLPLLTYSKSRYSDENALFNVVIGNQNYDAVVRTLNTEKRLEFSKYINGKLFNQEAKQLNEIGWTEVVGGDVIEAQNEYLEQFRKCINKKSKIGYINTHIIFIVDVNEAFRFMFDFNAVDFKNKIIELLNETDFGENRIYLMLLQKFEPFGDEQVILIK